MGLAASQARLLTITSRKSDAQFESMRLSHQKLALSRSLANVSNDYQNALKKTKLYYDFYGNGSTDNILSYNLFMTPSYINDYTPVLLTNQQNRIVLSSNFVSAARVAGIPQEGLDGYIDTETRNRFIEVLTNLGEIDAPTADVIKQTKYNPNVGLGDGVGIYTVEQTESYSSIIASLGNATMAQFQGLSTDDLVSYQQGTAWGTTAVVPFIVDDSVNITGHTGCETDYNYMKNSISRFSDFQTTDSTRDTLRGYNFGTNSSVWDNLSLEDILYGDDNIVLYQNVQRGQEVTAALDINQYGVLNVVQTVIDALADEIETRCATDDNIQLALKAAFAQMNSSCWASSSRQDLGVTTKPLYLSNRYSYTYTDENGTTQTEYINTGGFSTSTYIVDHSTSQYGLSTTTSAWNNNLTTNNADMEVFDLPAFSYNDYAHCHYASFNTAEDLSMYGGNYTTTTGSEPAYYWYSLPNTICFRIDAIPSSTGTTYVGSNDADTIYGSADRNAAGYAIQTAANNMVLCNLYDATGPHGSTTYETTEAKEKWNVGNFGAISLTNFVRAWYTYFIQAYAELKKDGAPTDEQAALQDIIDSISSTGINFHQKNENSTFATELDLSALKFVTSEVAVEDGISNIATFYDTIINQICEYGWTENNQVKEDTSYLQEMLQSGKMFLFKLANDNYYYQKNYSTDTFIKEIADETAIAEAEAKYRTQKAEINAKEEELDIKMRNLDTEISALESEYEAVKKMISTNVQKAFQRYQS